MFVDWLAFAAATRGKKRSKVITCYKNIIGFVNILLFNYRLIAVTVFSVLSLIGAIASACIAGIIGFKIIKTRLDPDGMCIPPIEYPESGDDCEYKISIDLKVSF